jgi:hypothetical protein
MVGSPSQETRGSSNGNCYVTSVPGFSGFSAAQKAYTFMKAGVVKGLSIGFDTIQATYDGDIRHLTEQRLWEISCVTFPMNQLAQVSAVKSKKRCTRDHELLCALPMNFAPMMATFSFFIAFSSGQTVVRALSISAAAAIFFNSRMLCATAPSSSPW